MKSDTAFHALQQDRDAALQVPPAANADGVPFDFERCMTSVPHWKDGHLQPGEYTPYRYQKDVIDALSAKFTGDLMASVVQGRPRIRPLYTPTVGVASFLHGLDMIREFGPTGRSEQLRDDIYHMYAQRSLSAIWGTCTRRFEEFEREPVVFDFESYDFAQKGTLYHANFADLEARVLGLNEALFAPFGNLQMDEMRRYIVQPVGHQPNDGREKTLAHDSLQRRGGGKGEKARQRKFRRQFIK